MKIKLSILLISASFLFACSPSEDTASVQATAELSDANDVILVEPEEIGVQDSAPNNDLIPIPMSDSFENGRYFLTSQVTEDGIESIEYIRKGNESDAYGKMQIKCSNNEIRKHSTDNPETLKSLDLGDWYTPTPDWTDQDIVNFVCS
ncbi:hypothetical protein KPY62_11385 [Psychrobacter sp. TAE2020]|uniref:hypothetical protein n=1 Tax=Psychrobacter sp. TAE2020 TaxID=2846762 RepID=UPI001C0F6F5B|nr:hypothetical protein [Psychrobacter sp. TAE2020]MBU5617684.1 hypothetical protein [Psychrobacter sp. TAE2020]